MNIRVARRDDIETVFNIRTGVVENYQSREEIAELGINALKNLPKLNKTRFSVNFLLQPRETAPTCPQA